jgi:hypothetical protein
MEQQRSTKPISRHVMAFVAAALFYLAGFIEFATGLLFSRHATSLAIGALFVCIGSLWMVIGAKYKKEAQQS